MYNDPAPLNFITPALGSATNPPLPLPDGVLDTPLLNVFNLDRLNRQGDPVQGGDGFFDIVPNLTFDAQNGWVFFTSAEPFGEFLFEQLRNPNNPNEDFSTPATYNANQAKYVYREMYRTTKSQALENIEKNKFQLRGRFRSTGQDGIPIGGFNIPRGSVVVTAGGRVLQEGLDYTVDYQLGRVNILDQSLLNSNTPIQVRTENNSVFRQQTRRFTGVHIEHMFSENFQLGGTFLNFNERPITQKSNLGTEPVNNTIVGINLNYSTEVPFLTRLANMLPNVQTEAPSNFSVRAELAYLFPGSPKNDDLEGQATAYIDDFEGSQTGLDIKSPLAWFLASSPIGFGGELPNGDLAYNHRRARLAWYTIDPIFYSNQRPADITDSDLSLFSTRRVFINELFPNIVVEQGQLQVLNTLDLAYFPTERGPYNFNPSAAGTNNLPNPANNWAGVTRAISNSDFEIANVEFIEFWLMDPFLDNPTNQGGKLYINLGSISEDVLKDGRKQYENGLPDDGSIIGLIETPWGRVPQNQALVFAFDTSGAQRDNQDLGLDGLNNLDEGIFYPAFAGLQDPAGDDYQYFLQATGSVVERYKRYNNLQGNSPTGVSDTDRGRTTLPDLEDIDRDNTMNTVNSYFQYEIELFPNMDFSNNRFITDIKELDVNLQNGQQLPTRWVQFKIPVREFDDAIGGINDFRSIRFMRMFLSDFEQETILRFGTLDLVRGSYRRFTQSLQEGDPDPDDDGTRFDVESVDIENNESRQPIPYVLPPGIERERFNNRNQIIPQNEQSLVLRVCDLEPDDSRAVFRNVNLDVRQYEKLRMFLHAESLPNELPLSQGDMSAFVRIGTDVLENYYEIQIPLLPTNFGSTTPEQIWPLENRMDLDLGLLAQVKTIVLSDPNLSPGEVHFFDEGDLNPAAAGRPNELRIGIKGNPNFGDIRSVMLGVVNSTGNGQCGEVWFNEMRVAGLKNSGGWATFVSMDANIADFANFSTT
ncbi:MAG: cell surface protein SprA, partial [Flavobacteriaceae bacterium]|nr:cell surface protein SprA [Flavobacteriaceae bacterium]